MLKVNRSDLGFTCSSVGFGVGGVGVVCPGSLSATVGVVGMFSIGLFEKREESFEKNEERAALLIADVS